MPKTAAPAAQHTVRYGPHEVAYHLEFRRRRSVGFRVLATGAVHVAAPLGTPAAWVAEQVLRKAPWILKHQARFEAARPVVPARQYLSGESQLFLGQEYSLLIIDATRPAVQLLDNQLVVAYPAPHAPERTAALLAGWYRQQAAAQFAQALARTWPRFAEFRLPVPTLFVRQMQTRWGSCTPATGRIRLNVDLVRTDETCIDYVLVHECCHLLVPDHSARFYALQTRLLPGWQQAKALLASQQRLH
ncbi:SprT family zinc-dependent metalloprotease [Hymenobacter sp. H14-R3]|uniref:M48 family metallopeptidase n=1 Tax=Hymenobacter sp. H14-R3 TaxID=3046308 RepID=UPI0024B8808F|nr:SprT family zinc-dependent metalloprotease [Hymenobacter sp. H14-R3]MDJ0366937.1 SprT family zinc-dependent metalloprotease [Hymenobacter sp. H14-R3]